MGRAPELAMFHRFAPLNALNLLYYQAELAHLQRKFDVQVEADKDSENKRKRYYDVNWYFLADPHYLLGGFDGA